MPHEYDAIVRHLRAASAEMRALGLGSSLSKGRVGELLLAHALGHKLIVGDKGADAIDGHGRRYEYKVSDDDQYNYFFGKWRSPDTVESYLTAKFRGYEGSYCALTRETAIVRIVYVPMTHLLPTLVAHLRTVKQGAALQKNHGSLDVVLRLPGATEIPVPAMG